MLSNNKSLLFLIVLSLSQIYFVSSSREKKDLHYHDHDHHDHLHDHHHDHHELHHGHDHSDEHPAYKYSRAANEKLHEKDNLKENIVKPTKRLSKDVWFEAITSTLIISIIPYIVLIFIPINNPHDHHSLLKVLLSFASGGLLGDAFLHLIPHALMAQQPAHGSEDHHHHHHHHHHDNSDSHDHGHVHDMSVGLWVLTGILVFLVIEKFVRIVKGSHHNHSHHHSKKLSDSESKSDESCSENEKKKDVKNKKKDVKNQKKDVKDEIKVAGYLNLAADFAHNFTDGLAIGASFLAGNNIGYVTTLTILFHEVPHEIGDFAILIQSGCSKTKAMTLQLVTAVGALSGTVLSLAVEGMSSTTSSWILPFTAGGFIYIATVSVIPELLEGSNFKNSFFEIIALIVGVLSMVLIAQYE